MRLKKKLRKLEALAVMSTWLFDIGCPDDLMGKEAPRLLARYFMKVAPRSWSTANGESIADQALPMSVAEIGGSDAEVFHNEAGTGVTSKVKKIREDSSSRAIRSGEAQVAGKEVIRTIYRS